MIRCDKAGRGWIEAGEFKMICGDMGISTVGVFCLY